MSPQNAFPRLYSLAEAFQNPCLIVFKLKTTQFGQ